MSWICHNCGIKLPHVLYPVHCGCGWLDPGDAEGHIDNPRLAERYQVCESCGNYMGKSRCKLLELGCRRDFLRVIRKPLYRCPTKKWPLAIKKPPEDQHPQGATS